MLGHITGHTCGFNCWMAEEDVCHCSCGGANHGIMRQGGSQPQRTAKIGGQFYELVAVVMGRQDGECWTDADRRTREAVQAVSAERFPDCDWFAYGEWRPAGKFPPVLDRKVSDSQAKWAECQAVPNAYRLVWARPAGTAYAKRAERSTAA